jgi:hypothetical protein
LYPTLITKFVVDRMAGDVHIEKNTSGGLWICWNLFLTCPGEELVYEIVVTITSTISVLSLITRAAIDDRQSVAILILLSRKIM